MSRICCPSTAAQTPRLVYSRYGHPERVAIARIHLKRALSSHRGAMLGGWQPMAKPSKPDARQATPHLVSFVGAWQIICGLFRHKNLERKTSQRAGCHNHQMLSWIKSLSDRTNSHRVRGRCPDGTVRAPYPAQATCFDLCRSLAHRAGCSMPRIPLHLNHTVKSELHAQCFRTKCGANPTAIVLRHNPDKRLFRGNLGRGRIEKQHQGFVSRN